MSSQASARRQATGISRGLRGLVRYPRFRRLLAGRMAGMTAENGLLYSLLIALVERTNSSFNAVLLIIAYSVPAVVFGPFAGALSDRWPKRTTLVTTNLVRAGLCAALALTRPGVLGIYLVIALLSFVGQFNSPAEAAALPAVVTEEEYGAAHSLFELAQVMGQVVGMALIAPIILKPFGAEPVYVLAAIGFVYAGYMQARIPRLDKAARLRPHQPLRGFLDTYRTGWDTIRADRTSFFVVLDFVLVTTLLKLVVVLMPHYVYRVLHLDPTATVYIAAPAAVGGVLGLLIAPWLGALFSHHRVVTGGFWLYAVVVWLLGLEVSVATFVSQQIHLNIAGLAEKLGISSLVVSVMMLAVPLGLAFSLVGVGTRAALSSRTPEERQAAVFGTQSAAAELFSLLPLLIGGAIADIASPRYVLLAFASVALLAELWTRFRYRPRQLQPARQPA